MTLTEITKVANKLAMAYHAARDAREMLDETCDDALFAFAKAAEEAAWRAFEAFHTRSMFPSTQESL